MIFGLLSICASKRRLGGLLVIIVTIATVGVAPADAGTCSPVPCEQIKVAIPYSLERVAWYALVFTAFIASFHPTEI